MLRLRVRFPDGASSTLDSVPAEISFAEFRKMVLPSEAQKRPVQMMVAGPPARPLELADEASIATALRSGDTLLVTPLPGAEGAIQKAIPRKRSQAAVSTLREEQPSKTKTKASRAQTRKRNALFAKAGRGQAVGSENGSSRDATKDENSQDSENGGADALGRVGAALVHAVAGDGGVPASVGKGLKDSLQLALEERQREAEGERRYAALLSGRYQVSYFRLQGDNSLTFRVRYRPPGSRKWRQDPAENDELYSAWSVALLGAVLKYTIENDTEEGECREGLRVSKMAYRSPRMFWNLVRHFGSDVETKMRGLVPDADWSFLNSRKRSLSEKAKRNLENERMFKRR